jgi:hypothetical protein
MGDEPLTRALLDRLGSRQGTMPPQPLPTGTDAESDTPRTQPILSRDAIPDAVMLQDQLHTGFMPSPN